MMFRTAGDFWEEVRPAGVYGAQQEKFLFVSQEQRGPVNPVPR